MTTGYIVLGRPDWTRPRLAPTGDRLAAVRWHDGAANIWIGSSKAPMALQTDLRPWRLREFHWGLDGRGLVLVLDDAGVHQRRGLAWLDLRSGALTRLTAERGADAQYVGQTGTDKPRILISVRQQTGGCELQEVTVTGEVMARRPGPGKPVACWLATDTQAVAVCVSGTTCTWWHSPEPGEAWSPIAEIPAADAQASRPLAFAPDGQSLLAISSAGRDTLALVQMSAPYWSPEVLSASERFDITSVLMSPDGTRPDLVTSTDPETPQTSLGSEAAAANLARLVQVAGGAPARILGRNATHCLAEISYPVGGPAYITFSRTTKAVSKPLVRYTGLSRVRMHKREPFSYLARDGLPITGFLTRPAGEPPWPAVLVIHDGPWARDSASMDPWAQYLASAGLCCIQVNYRGSRGFGKKFRDAGSQQWARAMQDDLIDALQSAPVCELVDPDRIAAMGHGYGGYAALMLSTQSQIPLSCLVSASAPTDLVRYAGSLMSFGGPTGFAYAARIGEPVEERERLSLASPINRVDEVSCPLLLFHGRQDARIPVSHATAFADALRRAGKRHDLTVYDDEGHWYARPQNIADFRLRTVEFLLSSMNKADLGVS